MLIEIEVKIELPVGLFCLPLERLEQVLDAVRGECRLAKDTHDFKLLEICKQFQFLLYHNDHKLHRLCALFSTESS